MVLRLGEYSIMIEAKFYQCLDYVYNFKSVVMANLEAAIYLKGLSPANLLNHFRLKYQGPDFARQVFIDEVDFEPLDKTRIEQTVVAMLKSLPIKDRPPQFNPKNLQQFLLSQDFSWFEWTAKIILEGNSYDRQNFLDQPWGAWLILGFNESIQQLVSACAQMQRNFERLVETSYSNNIASREGIWCYIVIILNQHHSVQLQENLKRVVKPGKFKQKVLVVRQNMQALPLEINFTFRRSKAVIQEKSMPRLEESSVTLLRDEIANYLKLIRQNALFRYNRLKPQFQAKKKGTGFLTSIFGLLKDEKLAQKKSNFLLVREFADISLLTGEYKDALQGYSASARRKKDMDQNIADQVFMQCIATICRQRSEFTRQERVQKDLLQELRSLCLEHSEYHKFRLLVVAVIWFNVMGRFSRVELSRMFEEAFKRVKSKEGILVFFREQYAVCNLKLANPSIYRYFQIVQDLSKKPYKQLPMHALRFYLLSEQGFGRIPAIQAFDDIFIVKIMYQQNRKRECVYYLRQYLNNMAALPASRNRNTVVNFQNLITKLSLTPEFLKIREDWQPVMFPSLNFNSLVLQTNRDLLLPAGRSFTDAGFLDLFRNCIENRLVNYTQRLMKQIPIRTHPLSHKRAVAYPREVQPDELCQLSFSFSNQFFSPVKLRNLQVKVKGPLGFQSCQQLQIKPGESAKFQLKGKFLSPGKVSVEGLVWQFSIGNCFFPNFYNFEIPAAIRHKQQYSGKHYFKFEVAEPFLFELSPFSYSKETVVGQIQRIKLELKANSTKISRVQVFCDRPSATLFKTAEMHRAQESYIFEFFLRTQQSGQNLIRLLIFGECQKDKTYKLKEVLLKIQGTQSLRVKNARHRHLCHVNRLTQFFVQKQTNGDLLSPQRNFNFPCIVVISEGFYYKEPYILNGRNGWLFSLYSREKLNHIQPIHPNSLLGSTGIDYIRQLSDRNEIGLEFSYQDEQGTKSGLLLVGLAVESAQLQFPLSVKVSIAEQSGREAEDLQVVPLEYQIYNYYNTELQFRLEFVDGQNSYEDVIPIERGVVWEGPTDQRIILQPSKSIKFIVYAIVYQEAVNLNRALFEFRVRRGAFVRFPKDNEPSEVRLFKPKGDIWLEDNRA